MVPGLTRRRILQLAATGIPPATAGCSRDAGGGATPASAATPSSPSPRRTATPSARTEPDGPSAYVDDWHAEPSRGEADRLTVEETVVPENPLEVECNDIADGTVEDVVRSRIDGPADVTTSFGRVDRPGVELAVRVHRKLVFDREGGVESTPTVAHEFPPGRDAAGHQRHCGDGGRDVLL